MCQVSTSTAYSFPHPFVHEHARMNARIHDLLPCSEVIEAMQEHRAQVSGGEAKMVYGLRSGYHCSDVVSQRPAHARQRSPGCSRQGRLVPACGRIAIKPLFPYVSPQFSLLRCHPINNSMPAHVCFLSLRYVLQYWPQA